MEPFAPPTSRRQQQRHSRRWWLRIIALLTIVAAGSLFLWIPIASADNCSTFDDCFGQSGAASEATLGLMLLAALSLLLSFLPTTSGQDAYTSAEIAPWARSLGLLGSIPPIEVPQLGTIEAVGTEADLAQQPDPSSSREPGDGIVSGPAGAVADQLRQTLHQVGDVTAQVHEMFPDPGEAQTVLDLLAEGATLETAAATVSGDWSQVPGGDPSLYTDEQRKSVIEWLGLNAGDTAGAAQGVTDLFDGLDDWIVASVFNEGMTVSQAISGTNVQLAGSAYISNSHIGPGFSQISMVEVKTDLTGAIGLNEKTLVKVLEHLGGYEKLSEELKEMFQGGKFPYSVEFDRFVGLELEYSATIGPEQTERLAAGHLDALPDIYNPDSFEPGNSALIQSGDVEGTNFALRYKKFVLGGTEKSFNGLGFGVTKIDENTVAVFSGPLDAVENQTRVGVPGVSLSGTRVAELTDFKYAEIDISTPEGQQAYADFISGNGVPTTDSLSVSAAEKSTVSLEADLGLGLGPVEFSISDTEASRTLTTFADGRVAMSGEAIADDAYFTYTFDPATEDIESATIVISDIREDAAQSLRVNGLGQEPLASAAQDIQMVFTNDDLVALQEMAKAAQGLSSPAPPGPNLSLRDGIVAAETPAEIAELLRLRTFGDPENTLHELEQIAREVSVANTELPTLPGQFEFRPTQ